MKEFPTRFKLTTPILKSLSHKKKKHYGNQVADIIQILTYNYILPDSIFALHQIVCLHLVEVVVDIIFWSCSTLSDEASLIIFYHLYICVHTCFFHIQTKTIKELMIIFHPKLLTYWMDVLYMMIYKNPSLNLYLILQYFNVRQDTSTSRLWYLGKH